MTNFALNAAIAAAGAALCFATVYPTFNDAAVAAQPAGVAARDILGAIANPAPPFATITLGRQVAPTYLVVPWTPVLVALGGPLLVGATFGLIERKDASPWRVWRRSLAFPHSSCSSIRATIVTR